MVFLVGLFLVSLIIINPVLNYYIQEKFVSQVNNKEGQNLQLNNISFNLFTNTISAEEVSYSAEDSIRHLNLKTSSVSVAGIPWINLIWGGGLSFRGLVIEDPDLRIKLIGKSRETKEETKGIIQQIRDLIPTEQKPLELGYIKIENGKLDYLPFESTKSNLINFSVNVDQINIADSASTDSLPLVLAKSISGEINNLFWRFPEKSYDLKIKNITYSSADSTFNLNQLSMHSYKTIEEFFAGKQYRTSKISIDINEISFSGFAYSNLLLNKEIFIRSAEISGSSLDFLGDRRVPQDPALTPKMPHELAASLDYDFNIRVLKIKNAEVKNRELWETGISELPFTSVFATIINLSSSSTVQNPVNFDIQGNLAGTGELKIKMELPLNTDILRFSYEGSLGKMSVIPLNSHLEIANKVKLTSGQIESVTFQVKCEGNSANAGVVPVYNNLKIQTLNKESEEGGLFQDLKTLFANKIKIRESNPDKDGKIESGNTVYVRQESDFFLRLVWFAIRTSLGEVVGF